MKRCHLDKIGSVTLRLGLDRNAVLSSEIPARAGTVVACRVRNSKTSYNTLEDVHGRMVTLHPGDVIAGALGHRDALRGYSGRVPERVEVGDTLQLLNVGGVIGAGAREIPGLGPPFELEVLGSVLHFPHLDRRVGFPASIERVALPAQSCPPDLPPVLALIGTSMDSGKTTAATALITGLTRAGVVIAAGKLTGVSLRRDILHMQDCGARSVGIFTDFGVVTTDESNAVGAAHSLLAHLAETEPDLIVLELGDGLLGTYGVRGLLADPHLAGAIRVAVLCAQDPVGAWGGCELLRGTYGIEPTLISGPVTDSPTGMRFCENELELSAWNAVRDGAQLPPAVRTALALSEIVS